MGKVRVEAVGIAAFGILTDLLPALVKKGILSDEEVESLLAQATSAQSDASTSINDEAAHLIDALSKSLTKP